MDEARAQSRRRFAREFFLASLFYGCCLALSFRPLLSGLVDSAQQSASAPPQALVNLSEMVYEVESAVFSQAQLIRRGVFPSWSPFSQGGTPLIGKMQNAVFAPEHLPFYVSPQSLYGGWLSFVTLLRSFLAFAFTYLLARLLGLNLLTGTFAGILYTYLELIVGANFSWAGAGLYMPALLLVSELALGEQAGRALALLPLVTALTFFSGHFESAFWMNAMAGFYFLARARSQEPAKWIQRAAVFAGLMLAGAAIAAVQILPAIEYLSLSYNRIWHDARWFSFWEYETIYKHLSAEDAPVLICGWAAALGGIWCLRRSALLYKAASSVLLAFALALLYQVGLNDAVLMPATPAFNTNIPFWCLLALALWAWTTVKEAPLKALGWLMIAGLLIWARTPPLSNLLLNIPLLSHFHNTQHRWELYLGLAMLSATALQRIHAATPQERRRLAGQAAILMIVLAAAYAFAQPLKGFLAQSVTTGIAPERGQRPESGGFMGAEVRRCHQRTETLAGWISSSVNVRGLAVALIEDGKPVLRTEAHLAPSTHRLYFYADMPLDTIHGQVQAAAIVQPQQGDAFVLRGPTLYLDKGWDQPFASAIALSAIAALPLLLFFPSPVFYAGCALLVWLAIPFRSVGVKSGDIPYPLPGLAGIKEDPDLFRVSSLQYNFMQADYSAVYGLSDIRTGGDNLDVLSNIYFSQLTQTLLEQPRNSAAFDMGLRLLGMANVKYLLQPDASLHHPALELVHPGPDLAVYRMKYFQPRAFFQDRAEYVPMEHWRDWDSRGPLLQSALSMMSAPGFHPDSTIMLNEPSNMDAGSAGKNSRPNVRVASSPMEVKLSVDADRPGFVFLSDTFFPGWQAYLNGEKTQTLRAWLTFRAVAVPRGASTVVFRYESALLQFACGLSALGALAWLILLLRSWTLKTAAPIQPKKKRDAPNQGSLSPPAAPDCLSYTSAILCALGFSGLAFWLFWSAFLYAGDAWIRSLARALFVAVIGVSSATLIQRRRLSKSGN